jgi:hypothetical protein
MAEDVVGVGKTGRKRQDDAAPARVGETTGALLDEAAVDIGLLEAAVGSVEHDRLTSGERVIEHG